MIRTEKWSVRAKNFSERLAISRFAFFYEGQFHLKMKKEKILNSNRYIYK